MLYKTQVAFPIQRNSNGDLNSLIGLESPDKEQEQGKSEEKDLEPFDSNIQQSLSSIIS